MALFIIYTFAYVSHLVKAMFVFIYVFGSALIASTMPTHIFVDSGCPQKNLQSNSHPLYCCRQQLLIQTLALLIWKLSYHSEGCIKAPGS